MIVITGASDGLGLEIAKQYIEAGKRVVNVSRRECPVATDNLLHDLSIGAEITAAAEEIIAFNEPIEAIINCVGVWGEEPFGQMTETETDALLSANIKAPALFLSALIDRIKKDGADVVNVASTAGQKGSAGHPLYAATKWGERGLTESLREELKSSASRVVGVNPGGMKTKFFEKALEKDITEDGSYWMEPAAVAKCIVQILELPKGIEVSEITLNRKK
jgi:short-subunit dehydrogenase